MEREKSQARTYELHNTEFQIANGTVFKIFQALTLYKVYLFYLSLTKILLISYQIISILQM